MGHQIVHKGTVREYELFPPWAWPYWHQRTYDESGRRGLPLIVALHGGGQDPTRFGLNWPFPVLFSGGDSANWEDRAIVVYPLGFAYQPWLDGEPLRIWNPGFGGGVLRGQNDVGFITAMIAAIERMMTRELRELGIPGPAIDPNRRFLFGYSAGGMMSYRVVSRMPDYWAALWVQSSAYGGRSYHGLTKRVTNLPRGRHGVSLFAHHGEDDTVVPPGPITSTTGLAVSDFAAGLNAIAGLPAAEARQYTTSYRHLAAAVQDYRVHNNCEPEAFEYLHPDPNGVGGVTGLGGAETASRATWRQAGDPPNPEVIAYVDPDMDHSNFQDNPYFTADHVWDFFKSHPRVAL